MENQEQEVTESLGSVRKKTDTSLANERIKTDASIAQEQDAAEKRADELVAKNRLQTDRAQTDERRQLDAKKEEARSSDEPHDLKSERDYDDSSLEQERIASDLAQKQERANSDAAIAKERRRIRLAAEALFALERDATDADLLGERDHVDSEADAHHETKAMMAVMSNNLKDPLDAISKLGETLQASLISEKIVSPQIYRLLGLIRRNSSVIERLVADLLDLESLSSGNLQLFLAQEKLNEVFDECSSIFGLVATTKNIKLTTSCSECPLVGTFDRDRILQVLSNLIQYALNHVPTNGTIAIGAIAKESQLEVSISYNGDGIPENEQAGIFDKFSQSTKLRGPKSGLGLHVCKGIVEAHGGTILVESNPSRGSTFRFTLPLGSSASVV